MIEALAQSKAILAGSGEVARTSICRAAHNPSTQVVGFGEEIERYSSHMSVVGDIMLEGRRICGWEFFPASVVLANPNPRVCQAFPLVDPLQATATTAVKHSHLRAKATIY